MRLPWQKKKEPPFEPEKDTGEKKPVRARIAAGDPNDKFSDYPSNGLNPVRLASIFREADEGNVWRQMELYEEMEEKDPHLFSQLQTRKLAVTGLEWEVQPFSGDGQDKEIADFVQRQLKALENMPDIMMDMLDAVGKGISVCEIDWGVSPGLENVIKDIVWVHPKKLMWDGLSDEMKICTAEHPEGIPLPQNKFAVHKYKAKSGHPSRAGILRICAWMYLFKNYDVKDWIAFCEVYGMPLRIGKYDPGASEEDKISLMKAILELGSDAAGIIPTNTSIDFIDSNKTATAQIYELLARYCDEQMSKAILGQTLTSGTDGGGSYALGKTHSEVRHDLTAADSVGLSGTIRRDIIGPLVEYNFGPAANLPFFSIACQESEDLKELMEIYKGLAVDIGLPIPKSHVYKKFHIPAPEPGEMTIEVPHTAADMPGIYKELMLKESQGQEEQQMVNRMEKQAVEHAEKEFRQMFEPLFDIAKSAESPEQLLESLKNKATLRELYEKMKGNDLGDLIRQATYLSHLIGRSMD